MLVMHGIPDILIKRKKHSSAEITTTDNSSVGDSDVNIPVIVKKVGKCRWVTNVSKVIYKWRLFMIKLAN